MNFLIISGMSGAGKSRAAITLEDLGYYCVDNLPADIIPQFVQFCMATNGEYEKVAMVTDVRSGLTAESYERAMARLDELGCEYSTLFLEASTETIIKRYKETRRTHPFSRERKTLQEAVEAEREHLAPIRKRADEVLDTTSLNANKLRGELTGRYGGGVRSAAMTVTLMSFGFKYGIPLDADLVLDVRVLPNPYYIDELRSKTGMDKAVYDYVLSFEQSQEYLRRLENWLEYVLPLYADMGKTGLSICVGCTGGHHRSVTVARALGAFIAEKGYATVVHHRDMNRE